MKKFLFQTILLLATVGFAFYFFTVNPALSGLPFLSPNAPFKKLQIGDSLLRVELADTQDKRKKGLGGREVLASNEGMLFVFPDIGKYPFWMKGLSFPLDFIWIKNDQVVDLVQNVPQPAVGQSDSALPIYQSKEDINKVLEVPAGTINRLNIKVGDMIKLLP